MACWAVGLIGRLRGVKGQVAAGRAVGQKGHAGMRERGERWWGTGSVSEGEILLTIVFVNGYIRPLDF